MSFLCKNGHAVKFAYQAGLECSACRANQRRREKRKLVRDWFEKYYPITAYKQTRLNLGLLACTLHAIRKWQGIGKPGSPKPGDFIGSDSCALCQRGSCSSCLPELRGCNASSPYQKTKFTGEPIHILKALHFAAFRVMMERAIEKSKEEQP